MKAAERDYTQTDNTKKMTEFHCKGSFKVLHKGKPNAEDLKAVSAFAKDVII